MKNMYLNLTQLASKTDGEPTVNRQSRLMLRQGKRSENGALSSTCLRSASVPLSFRSRYLRYAAVIFCVLAMSVGQVWGGTITWDFGNETSSFTKGSDKPFTGSDGKTVLTYKSPDSDSFAGDAPNKYLKMGGASKVSSNIYNLRYFELTAPSKAGTISITYAADNATNASIHTNTNNGVLRTTITATASTKCTSSTIGGLVAGTTKIQIAFPSKAYIKAVEWNDVDAPTRSYYSIVKSSLETGAALSLSSAGCASEQTGGAGLLTDFAKYYSLSTKTGQLTVTFSSALTLNSNGSNRGCIRIYYGTQPFSLTVDGVATGSSYSVYNSTYVNVAEYTIPNGKETLTSFTMVGTGSSTGGKFYAVEVLTWPAAACEELAAPTGLTCVDQSYNTLSFSWDAVANASSYDVFLYTDEECTVQKGGTANTSNTTCRIRDLDPGTTYYCKVQTKGDGSTYCTSGGTTATAVSGTTLSSTRKFKSDETIFFKDAGSNIGTIKCLWVVDGGNVYAYFYKDAGGDNWADGAGVVVRESHHYGNAIYKFTVPKTRGGDATEWDGVIFTRGTAATWGSGYYGQQTHNQSPNQNENLFTISTNDPTAGKYNGSWSLYANGAAVVGDMNNWRPDKGEFNYSGSTGTVYMDLEANTEYKFKVLDGTGWKGCGGTITNTTTSWWKFNTDEDCTVRTGEEGNYAFKWDNSGDDKYLGIYYPQARLKKGEYIYFDARDNSTWTAADFDARFWFKYYDSDSNYPNDVTYHDCAKSNAKDSWVYPYVVPNSDYIGQVQMNRIVSGSWNANADKIAAHTRTSSKQNCIKLNSSDASTSWTTYCPPMSSSTLSDNSTVVIPGTSGNGTEGNPYIVPTSGTIQVQASATKAVDDDNMTKMFDFKVGGSSQQNSTTATYSKGSLSNNTTYTITVDAYNTYNETNGIKSTPAALYYKALNQYSVSVTANHLNQESGATGSNKVIHGYADYVATFTTTTGYALPASVTTITAGGSDIKANCTWNSLTGTLTIPAAYVTGNIVIVLSGTQIPVTGITVSPSSKTLDVGGTQTLTATAEPATALDKTVTWTTSNSSIATVNSSGVVTAVAAGSCTITATANDGSDVTGTCAITVTAAATCTGDPTALVSGALYKVEDMASACATTLTVTGQYKYGLSTNGKFYVVGTTNDNNSSTGTVEMKTGDALSDVGSDTDADFTNYAWLKMAGSTSHHSIKFVIPTGGGTLTVYGKGGGSTKGNVQIKENSTGTVTEVIAKGSTTACKSSAISVNAGTYYIYSSGESAALYGLKFVETSCSTPTTAFANGTYTIGGSALDLSTLISGKQGTGAITYTVKNANGTGASIAGTSFTATSAGTATVTATQAADATYCEKEMDATITVSAAPAGDCHKYFYYGVLSAPSPAPTKNEDSFFSSVPSTGSSASESWEIDDVTYTTSSRCSNSNNIGTFTIPSGKVATMYVMFNGSSSYTMTITKGGSNYKTGIDASSGIKKYTEEDMGPGTYAVTTTGNVGLYLLIVDVCDATPCTVAPTVSATTTGATTSTTQVVNCSGISSLGTGTCTITAYGFVYGTSANPTLSDSHVEVGTSYTVTGTAFAETTLTGLTPSNTYYVRAYATNGAGTGYGDDVSFTTSAAPVGAPVITDQPDLSEVALGETASFSLNATGATSYQWYSCDSEGENKTEVSGASATTDNYSYTTTATGTTYYICKVSNANGDTWSDVVGSIVNPVSFTIHYEAGATDKTEYTTETFTQTKEVNAAVADYIGSLTKFEFTGVGISDKGKDGTMSMKISMPTSEDAGKYVSFTFTVAPNYYLSVDNIDIQCQPVDHANHNYKVVLTDALGTTITGTSTTNTKGELNSINFPAAQLSGKRLVGLVTVKIFGWYSETDKYRLAKNTYITGTVSSLPAPTASWTARPASATVGDGGKTYTLTTDGTNTVAWSITDQSGAIGATLSETDDVLSTTLSGYTTAGSLYVQASVTGDGIHYLSTPATLLRQRVVISAGCVETTLISATLSSGTATGSVTGTPGGSSAVSFTSVKEVDGGYKMGGDGSYVYLTLSDDENFAANDEVKITITKASDQGDGALHIYKYADASWTELGSVTAAGAGTYTYRLTESNVSTPFNTIGLYRTGKNQNPYVKALSVVRNSCSETKPHSVSVTASPTGPSYAIDDALTLTVEATNADTYQWYSNTNNTASDGFLLVGETANTYSPSTAIAGTTYYYCVATNESGSTVSNIITVTVNSAKTAPTVSWEDTYESPTYGGGGYAVKATVSDASWDGTLTTDMLTASDGVTLSGVSVAGKVITATYGVTETARSPLSFSLTLPETTNYTALAANKEITFDRCQADPEAVDAVTKLPVLSAYTTVNNVYRWATADVGWFTLETGASSISSESSSYSGFPYRSKSGKKYVLLYSELDAVKAVRLYVNGTGDNTTLSKVKTGTTYNKYKELEESTDYDFTYSNSSTSIASRENAYIEISFKTNLTANTFVEITLSRNTLYYGVELLTGSTEVGTIETDISWATDPGKTVNKYTTDANFRYEAVKASDAASQATLGTISYKSSVPAVATVSATGVVDVLSVGTTTITATLAGSGCYKKATKSYNLVVAEATCTDEAGTITASGSGITIDGNTVTKADACAAVTLTVSGHTGEDDGATYQWYKDGVSMGVGYRSKSVSVTANGDYTVEVTNAGDGHCTMPATNTITITGNAISITKIVDEWYVKNGRRTPDIALATIEGTTSYTVNDGSSNITTFAGCGFELRDGILYLKGQQENGDEPNGLTEGNATLTITAVNACGDNPTATITIHKQEETDKPSIAFIVDGTKGDPVNNVATAKTSSRPIWIYLSESFDLTGCNAYWTNNEKLIRQYYSQFDAIVITDDPSTDEKPKSGLKYVNALGTMVDVRPVLTMEAYVGKYGASSNWHIGGTPSSPNPRQYELKLQCKDHDIFSDLTTSANFRSEEIDGETYYYVTMVDNSVTPYAGLADDAETETYPALQGFSAASIKGTGMLGIGTISDGTLQGGVERQDEPTARMMILGIQHQAMAALTSEGKQVIKNAINYLLMTNMEDVNDCSNYFIGGTLGHEQDWHTASNWSSTKVPDASTKARILVPVTISTKVHVAQVDIAVDGRSIRYNSGNTDCRGSVTIAPTGALIVDGQVRRTTNGRLYTEEELQPTQIEDLTIGSDESNGNGTLIFDNSEGESQAIVQYYSKANTNENDEWNWQYMAVPFNDNSSAYRNFYDSYLYRWAENCSGWEVVPNQGAVYPWVGYTITQVGEKMYYMDGTLVETGEQTFTVPAGKNLVVGNSWTAPIQVKQFEDADFAGMSKNIYLFNTGYDPNGEGAFDKADGRYEGGTYVTIPIHSSPYTGDSLISSLQAFIVYAKTGEGGGTFTLDYDRHVRPARSTDKVNAGLMHAPKRGGVINDKPAVLKVWASGSRYDDRLIVLEREDFSTGLDEGWDGNKRVAGNSSPLIFAVTDNGREAVSAIPTMEGTLIGFWAGEDNEYTLHFEYDEEDELYLLDLDNNTYTPVNSNSTYVFTVPDKKAHNRFILTRNAPDPVATGVEETQANEKPEAKAIKFLKDEKVFIFVNGKLYDATGKVVK